MTSTKSSVTWPLRGKVLEARIEQFSVAVRERRERLSALAGPSATGEPEGALQRALAELEVQNEELTVADEELRVQMDELTRLSERVAGERQRYQELFDFAPDAYLITDVHGVILEANAAACAAFGVDRTRLRRRPLALLLEDDDVREFRDALSSIREKEPELELRIRSRSAGPRWMTFKGALSHAGTRILWLGRETSARRSMEQALIGTNASLEREVTARTADLARALRDKEDLLTRERHLREELEIASSSKDRFLAILSHDLRAPLNAVLGWTQLLRREILDQATRERALATIERNARAQADLIAELLDISRIATGKMQLDLRSVDLSELVARALESSAPEAADRGIELSGELDPGVAVLGDRARLAQVLGNLLSNALKFTPRGGTVRVTLRKEGGVARLRVSDTGRGISKESLPHVFECFHQESSLANQAKGLGLGLHIVRQIVSLHRGHVDVESAGPDQGTSFTIELPIPHDAAPPPAESSTDMVKGQFGLENVRILVVDDDEDARDLIALLLSRAGADVMVAADASTALALMSGYSPDVVVTDLAMPGKDGYALLVALRRMEEALHVPVVAVTAHASADEAQRAISAGFDAHVTKPVNAVDLLHAVVTVARKA
jgi:PAS domain S-box-containing protein